MIESTEKGENIMLTGVFEIDTETYVQMIHQASRERGNLLVLGQSGIGKTEIPIALAVQKMCMKYVYWNLSTQEAPDLVGLPIIKSDNGIEVVRYASPEYIPLSERTPEPVIVIVDELDKAKPELQNPLLEVFHSRTLNGRPLNIQCIIATANLPEENCFSKPISHALTNRCKVFKLKASFDAWQAWATGDQRMQSGPGGALISGFLARHQEYHSRPPVEGDPTAYVRCSPRSWAWAGYDLNAAPPDTSVDFQTLIVAGRVGQEPAAKFRVWLEHYRFLQPMIDDLVNNGKIPNQNDITIDKLLVMSIGSCSAVVQKGTKAVNTPKEKEMQAEEVRKATANVFKFLEQIPSEFQIASCKSALSPEFIQKFGLTKIPSLMKVYLNMKKVMSS